jgi:hypothetical protein
MKDIIQDIFNKIWNALITFYKYEYEETNE